MNTLVADMTPLDTHERALEAEADRLLWSMTTAPHRLAYSFYSTGGLARASRRDRDSHEPPPPDPGLTLDQASHLLDALLADIEMPERLRHVLALARRGLTCRQIATTMGIQQRTAHRWRTRALDLLRRHWQRRVMTAADPDLPPAYQEQAHMALYRDECHCAPGRESCRSDGICKHRWYLYHELPTGA